MNLAWVSALLVDSDSHSASLLGGMLEGFGMTKKSVVTTGSEAQSSLGNELFDIVFCDGNLPDMSSAQLIQSIRKLEGNPTRLLPIFVFAGYARQELVAEWRDAGANFVIKNPMVASVLYERLSWVAKGGRLFVESPEFIGPDRRFRNAGLPGGVGRRTTDLSGAIGQPAEPNVSQEEIDAMVVAKKIDI